VENLLTDGSWHDFWWNFLMTGISQESQEFEQTRLTGPIGPDNNL
jgi:hypothetical protein